MSRVRRFVWRCVKAMPMRNGQCAMGIGICLLGIRVAAVRLRRPRRIAPDPLPLSIEANGPRLGRSISEIYVENTDVHCEILGSINVANMSSGSDMNRQIKSNDFDGVNGLRN
ncbi:hypothetical protein [Burkholderia thailandensis]|uniref:hypothetical protein n=1 Tax=Burkholderia thailandensis TaxID=57975 RepID=UPI0018AFBF7C|nr:hypothetical protein [Burkholderia thailandensis]